MLLLSESSSCLVPRPCKKKGMKLSRRWRLGTGNVERCVKELDLFSPLTLAMSGGM